MARAVGCDGEVGLQQFLVSAHEAGDARAANLLLALQQQDDVAGQLAMDLEMGFDREDLGEVLALVVADAACIEATVADSRLEGRRNPFVERIRRLHVVMTVEQHGRLARRLLPARDDHGMSGGRHEAGFQPDLRQHLDQKGADLGDADVLGADARVLQIGDQPVEEGAAVGFDMIEDRSQGVGGSHFVGGLCKKALRM